MRPPLHQHSYVTGWEYETNQLHSSITSRIHLTLVCGIPLCFLKLNTVVLMECISTFNSRIKLVNTELSIHSLNNEASIHSVTSGMGIQVCKQGEAEKDINQRPESHFSTRQNRTLFIRNAFTFLTYCKWSVWLHTV
jgi:hypothetical protein